MSIDLVAAALWLPLEPTRKLVLIALCERADLRTGRCWPGRDEIAIRASLSPRRVSPHLSALEEAGYIRSTRGNRRLGQTTTRKLDVRRILTEGEAARKTFLEGRPQLGDVSSLNPNDQGTFRPLLGDVSSGLSDADGTIRGRCGDEEPSGTVIEPSVEPSLRSRARANRSGTFDSSKPGPFSGLHREAEAAS